jgi:hypothetical protein
MSPLIPAASAAVAVARVATVTARTFPGLAGKRFTWWCITGVSRQLQSSGVQRYYYMTRMPRGPGPPATVTCSAAFKLVRWQV